MTSCRSTIKHCPIVVIVTIVLSVDRYSFRIQRPVRCPAPCRPDGNDHYVKIAPRIWVNWTLTRIQTSSAHLRGQKRGFHFLLGKFGKLHDLSKKTEQNKMHKIGHQYPQSHPPIGIGFRSSPNRFTVFGARRYDIVLQRSEICIKLQLSVLMIAGSYNGFLLNAGNVWRTSRDRIHSWNSTRGNLWAFMHQKGIATGIALGLARPWKIGLVSPRMQT